MKKQPLLIGLIFFCLLLVWGCRDENLNRDPELILQLDVGDPGLYMVKPGDSQPLFITVRNTGKYPVRGRLEAGINSWEGRGFRVSGKVKLDSGETDKINIPRNKLGRRGIKWVHARVMPAGSRKDTVLADKEMAFAYMDPAGNEHALEQEMLLGIAYGAGPDHYSELAARADARVGFGLFRASMPWSGKNPDMQEVFEKVRIHQQEGVSAFLIVSGTAPFARLPGTNGQKGGGSPPEPGAWRTWIGQLARGAQEVFPEGQEVYWEIWNEPDIGFFKGTTDQYLEMLDIAHEEITKVDAADYRVMTGGFASVTHTHGKEDMIERVVTEGRDNWEYLAYHRHGHFHIFKDDIENHLQPILDKASGEVPIFLTETGMDTRRGEQYQAETMIKKILYSWSRGFKAYTWFNLHDMRRAEYPKQPGFTYGLYTKLLRKPGAREFSPENMDYANTYPKAAYVAMNTLSTLMYGMKRQGRLQYGPNDYLYHFRDGDRQLIGAWSALQSESTQLYLIPTDAERVERVDVMGNAETLSLAAQQTILEVAPEPAFVVFHGTANSPGKGEMLARTEHRGEGISTVVFRNPSSETIQIEYTWKPGEVFSLSEETNQEGRLELQAGQEKALEARVSIQGGKEVGLGSVRANFLQYRIEPLSLKGKMEVPTKVNAISVPHAYPAAPAFRMDQQDQVVNRFEHDPHTVHLMWKGWRDKSAQVWLARDEGALKIKTRVTDNVHHIHRPEIDEGDGVIIGLKVPGQDGTWKWAITHEGGKPLISVLSTPENRDAGYKPEINLNAGDRYEYEAVIREEAVGISAGDYRTDLRFNMELVDHDGDSRGVESHVFAAPVTEASRPDQKEWPRLILAE